MTVSCFSWLRSLPVAVVLILTPAHSADISSRVANLSTRAVVGSGADILIAGVVISGDVPKDVLIRAVGPGLTAAKVAGALTHPRLQVFDRQGKVVASNEHWTPELVETFAKVGAFSLPAGSNDAAVRVTLSPGSYTAQVSGVDAAGGIALVEIYEIDGNSRLINLSTRAKVETGDGLAIAGFVVSGGSARRVLIRAAGPALASFGVSGFLADPSLTILDRSGAIVASNDNWGDNGRAAEVSAAAKRAGAFAFGAGSADSGLIVDLDPGLYTVHVRGNSNGTGVALFELYDISVNVDSSLQSSDSVPAYDTAALGWTKNSISRRLGPKFDELNPGATDDRPTIYHSVSKPAPGYYSRIDPYEVGDVPGNDSNYWSDSGQVGYVPDDPYQDAGLDRIQTFAYYNRVFATSPRLDYTAGNPHSDPQTREASYAELNGGEGPKQPVAMVRSYGMQQNESLVIYRDGLFAVAGSQTSRSSSERPYPGFKFPSNKSPRALAITTNNEFALVVVWDTESHRGQLAVVALEGKFLAYHTWPYMALPNQGSWSDFKLLGYVDLPISSPNGIAAASNGWWNGPSATGGYVLSQIDLATDATRKLCYDGAWQAVVAKAGYAVVTSTEEDKVVFVDLTPLISYVRESYLGSAESFQRVISTRGSGPSDFPQTFDAKPEIAPTVLATAPVNKPSAVLAGQLVGRWSLDSYKAYVASQDGTIHIWDTSSIMSRYSWEKVGPLKEIGTVNVGRNPVSMTLIRHGEADDLPLLPVDSAGAQPSYDRLNNVFYVACRGDREVDAVVTYRGSGQIYRRIRDSRLGDPVAVSVAVRGHVVTIADFAGKKLLSYRVGTLSRTLSDGTVLRFPVGGDGTDDFEFSGELPLAGCPFLVNSTNVN